MWPRIRRRVQDAEEADDLAPLLEGVSRDIDAALATRRRRLTIMRCLMLSFACQMTPANPPIQQTVHVKHILQIPGAFNKLMMLH